MDSPEHQTEKQTIYLEGVHEGKKESKEEIEQLKKEKEWLISRYVFALGSHKYDCRKQLLEDMQQALKEK